MSTRRWNASQIEDQTGRVAIVTGASSGIGFETAKVLSGKNATVIIAVRSQQKGDRAVERILSDVPGANVSVILLDLANLDSVERFVNDFRQRYDRLDLLINNAGVMVPPYSTTKDGFELQMGTNHMGHFALTGQLMDLLEKTEGSRVVAVSSMAHRGGRLDFEDLDWKGRQYEPWKAYGDSKLANLYFVYELQRRLARHSKGPIIAAAHPGWTATDLQRHSGLSRFLNGFFAQDTTMGALPTLYAAVGPDVKSGDYFGPSGMLQFKGYPKKVGSSELSHDASIAETLWEVSEERTGVRYSS